MPPPNYVIRRSIMRPASIAAAADVLPAPFSPASITTFGIPEICSAT